MMVSGAMMSCAMVRGCYGEWDGERDVLVGATVIAAIVGGYYGVASVIISTRVSGAMVSCAIVSGCSSEFCDGELCGEWGGIANGLYGVGATLSGRYGEWVVWRVMLWRVGAMVSCAMVSGCDGEWRSGEWMVR